MAAYADVEASFRMVALLPWDRMPGVAASLDGVICPFVEAGEGCAAGVAPGDAIESDVAERRGRRQDRLVAPSFVRVTAASVRFLPEFRHRISLPETHVGYPPFLPRQSPNGRDPLWRWELQSLASCVLW